MDNLLSQATYYMTIIIQGYVLIILGWGPLWAQGYLEVLFNKELMLKAQCKAIATFIWKGRVEIHFINQKPREQIVNPICSELFYASLRGSIMNEYLARSLKYLKMRSKKHQNLTLCACMYMWVLFFFCKPAHSLKRVKQGSLSSEIWLVA